MKLKFALAGVLVAACGLVQAAQMPKEINIAYVKAPFNLQNMVMKDQARLEKAFEKYGTTVRWHTITSGAKQAQAMAAGSLDFSAVMNTASLLSTNGAGNPVLVANGVAHPSDNFALVGKPGAKMSVKDLKGKKVAGPRGTVLHQVFIAALQKEGMSIKDVEFLAMDLPAAQSALLSGNVDAALQAASGVIKAEEAGCKVITTAKGLVNVNLVLTVRKAFADQYPDAVKEVVRVQRETLQWINENKKAAIELGAKEHGISYKDAETLAKWSNFYDVVTEEDIKGLDVDQKFLIENNLMQKAVDVNALVLPVARQ